MSLSLTTCSNIIFSHSGFISMATRASFIWKMGPIVSITYVELFSPAGLGLASFSTGTDPALISLQVPTIMAPHTQDIH